VYFLVIEVFQTKRQMYVVLAILIFTAFSTALDSIVQYHITHKDIFLQHVIVPGGRATAGFKASNGLGAYWTIMIPVIGALLLAKNKKIQYYVSVSIVLMCFLWSLGLTFSRGAWLAVFVGSACMVVMNGVFGKWSGKLFSVFMLCLLIFGTGFLVFKNYPGWNGYRMETVQWRYALWLDCLPMIQDKPLFGHGINTFMRLFETYRRDYGSNPTYAHNCYLQLTVELGLFGLATFLWIFISLFRIVAEKKMIFSKENSDLMVLFVGLFCGILAFLVHSLFDTNFYSLQLSVFLWFTIGLLMVVNRLLGDGPSWQV